MAKIGKAATAKPTSRSGQTGRFVGRTKDGLLIPRPDFKPKSFTMRELDEAVRAVKVRRAVSQAG
jgi:hypothetical protein